MIELFVSPLQKFDIGRVATVLALPAQGYPLPMLIGVLGAGQLGQMLGQAGISLGARFRFFDPVPGGPASAVGECVTAPWDDFEALARFCEGLDVCTFEFENVPAATLEFCASRVRTCPNVKSLTTGQDRACEKAIFSEIGFDVPPHALVGNEAELAAAVSKIGVPSVLKCRRGGYDGKGQVVLRSANEAASAWKAIGSRDAILESFVPFTRELSIIASRTRSGATVFYPIVENTHIGGILILSQAPALVGRGNEQFARDRIASLLEKLDYCGTLAIEMFEIQTPDGLKLVPNEFAPRVHNTGHWTIDGSMTSQFENHIRGIMGLPLGQTTTAGHAAMMNLIGSHAPIEALAGLSGAHIHLYGKEPREGRKLGHVTFVGADISLISQQVVALRNIS